MEARRPSSSSKKPTPLPKKQKEMNNSSSQLRGGTSSSNTVQCRVSWRVQKPTPNLADMTVVVLKRGGSVMQLLQPPVQKFVQGYFARKVHINL
mmetsp:Transcript_105548/g.209734  ORF Transcript_105548/g.209734 Transcript_105548/m.209734 type:complete len:94 (-) Transcript_105548:117-398(-)